MSIAADIKKARAVFDDHVAVHKCRPAASVFDSQPELLCIERVDLWFAYMRAAYLWGIEPDDDQRQRDHFNRNLRPAAA